MEFYGFLPPHATRAWVAEHKGSTACVVGVEFQPGGAMAFSNIKEGLEVPKITIWRATLDLADKVKGLNIPINAVCNGDFLNSPKMLTKLGFTQHQTMNGEVYTWQP